MSTVDMNELIAQGNRALDSALGVDGTRMFINYYVQQQASLRTTDTVIEEAIVKGAAMVEKISANYTGPRGDFTKERHEYTRHLTHEEFVAEIKKAQRELTGGVPIIPRAVGK